MPKVGGQTTLIPDVGHGETNEVTNIVSLQKLSTLQSLESAKTPRLVRDQDLIVRDQHLT